EAEGSLLPRAPVTDLGFFIFYFCFVTVVNVRRMTDECQTIMDTAVPNRWMCSAR
ncbi:hypothetical protein U1Q18_015893, partial [Sarracenia purpurea var. burkii]